jgi:transketolase
MRREFLTGLADLADRDPRVLLLTADLGFGAIEVFSDRHPTRFMNLGVAEQAMIGIATGLAEGGFVPYCYSIGSFSVARTFEFLRNGPIAHGLPVRLVGIGPGMDYSYDGFTHFSLEDVGLLLNQPNTRIVAPKDAASASAFGAQGSDHAGLVYYRLARAGAAIETAGPEQSLDADCLILSLGDSADVALDVAEDLSLHGPWAVKCIAVEELDARSIDSLAAKIAQSPARVVVTTENHYSRGGFGSALSDALCSVRWRGDVVKWGVAQAPTTGLGSYKYMVEQYCPSISDIRADVIRALLVDIKQ